MASLSSIETFNVRKFCVGQKQVTAVFDGKISTEERVVLYLKTK
jgi:hypothetical protein